MIPKSSKVTSAKDNKPNKPKIQPRLLSSPEGTVLSRNLFDKGPSLKNRIYVPLEKMGGCVCIRALKGSDVDAFIAACAEAANTNDQTGLRAFLVALSVIDHSTGERMFTDEEVDAVNAFFDNADLEYIFRAAQDYNRLDFSEDDAEKGKGGSSTNTTSDVGTD